MHRNGRNSQILLIGLLILSGFASAFATPANKATLAAYYDKFLSKELNQCTTCHLPTKLEHPPESLEEFPHNPFGGQLRRLGSSKGFEDRLRALASDDSDGDGTANEIELLLGTNPGEPKSVPTADQLQRTNAVRAQFTAFTTSYRWKPFESVERPPLPKVHHESWARNEIDVFVSAEHEKRNLKPRPEASKLVLLRRVYLDLVGLNPTSQEQQQFLADKSPRAYENVVERLLNDPRHGERWGRHWMDIWRYSDWAGWSGGNQIRDSKPHIWRWRDWIVQALNTDKGYNQMLIEMLAADELYPEDTEALRATGFLVRNYKMLSREQWLEDTIKHTSQAFLGMTVGCAKCHDHMQDPVSQADYYSMRAIFEPHQVRTDRVPGELDLLKNGLPRVYDVDSNPPTYLLIRGDERKPDTNRLMAPAVPAALTARTALTALGGKLPAKELILPYTAGFPDKRDFVLRDSIAASQKALRDATKNHEKAVADGATNKLAEEKLKLQIAEAKHTALLAVLEAERLEDGQQKGSDEWKKAGRDAVAAQRETALLEAKLKLHQAELALSDLEAKKEEKNSKREEARKKVREAEKELADKQKQADEPLHAGYKSRPTDTYPTKSTGRRSAFAQWLTEPANPLTARVAVNHLWLRHFGRGLVPTPSDFGRSGTPPSHPALLDWLAAEFMARNWSMKEVHRLIVTSATYRMASTPDEHNAEIDPDNIYLWRMNSRRMEAELVRDNVLAASGSLDLTLGGPEIDHLQWLKSNRRSVYLRIAPEKEVEFLKIFDGPSVTECYQRHPTVMPQQALALANSELLLREARKLANELVSQHAGADSQLVHDLFERVLARKPTRAELATTLEFLNPPVRTVSDKPAEPSRNRRVTNLVLALFNHNDFVTIR